MSDNPAVAVVVHHAPFSRCPRCGVENDCATDTNSGARRPEIGDLSVCFECGLIGVFGLGLRIHEATPEEREAFSRENPEGWATLLNAVALINERNAAAKGAGA